MKELTNEERIANNRAIADSYYQAYDKKAVKNGAVYDVWQFAPHAEYWSPYFGNNLIDLEADPMSVEDSATMEAPSRKESRCLRFNVDSASILGQIFGKSDAAFKSLGGRL